MKFAKWFRQRNFFLLFIMMNPFRRFVIYLLNRVKFGLFSWGGAARNIRVGYEDLVKTRLSAREAIRQAAKHGVISSILVIDRYMWRVAYTIANDDQQYDSKWIHVESHRTPLVDLLTPEELLQVHQHGLMVGFFRNAPQFQREIFQHEPFRVIP
jgi:hypothetical protein